ALARAHSALEETRDQFIELYDFAPNGYLTLDRHGVVLRINLTGAGLLGRPRQAIEGLPLLGFVSRPDRPIVLDFLRRCRGHGDGRDVMGEFVVHTGTVRRDVQIICRPRPTASSGARTREFFTAL